MVSIMVLISFPKESNLTTSPVRVFAGQGLPETFKCSLPPVLVYFRLSSTPSEVSKFSNLIFITKFLLNLYFLH